MKIALIALLVGGVAGLLGALCGVGGGIVMVPAFKGLLSMNQKAAVATSLAVIVISALFATANNTLKGGLINWQIVAITAAGAAVASWFGADLMRNLSNPILTKIFAVTLIVFGVMMLVKK